MEDATTRLKIFDEKTDKTPVGGTAPDPTYVEDPVIDQTLISVRNAVPDKGAKSPSQPPLGNGHRPGLPKIVRPRKLLSGTLSPTRTT